MADKSSSVTMDANQFYKDAREDLKSLIAGAAVRSAVIFNDTKESVTFFVYNYIDIIYAIDATKALVAPGHYGTVAASGDFYKVHPNQRKEQEFLVAPGKAYIYKGPGAIQEVK